MSNQEITKAICTTLEQMKPNFKESLPAHIDADKFVRTAKNAVQANPELLKADRRSLFLSCQQAAQDGLIIDGREAALVMFKSQCQYMPMLAGVLKKVRNSGHLSTITAEVVYENDKFSYKIENGVPNLTHEPDVFGERGKPKGVYATAVLKDGGVMTEVMSMDDINKVKSVSRGANSAYSPWNKWWEQMACKSVLRRLSKKLPQSTDLEVIYRDDSMYELDGKQEDVQPHQDELQPKKRTRAESVILGDDVEDAEFTEQHEEHGEHEEAVIEPATETQEGDVL